jgi:peptidoglycan/LPS O-acetylase OafA/YrhL
MGMSGNIICPIRGDPIISPHYRPFGTFRLILAFAVVVSHFQESLIPAGMDVHEKILGRTGVFLFFVLSGYVIAEALNLFYQGRIKQFLINRSLRIFPPFLAALAIGIFTYIIFTHYNFPHLQLGYSYSHVLSPESIFLNLFSVFDFRIPKMEEDYYLTVRMVWTLVIEWQFYVAFALICFAIDKRRKQAHQQIILFTIGISSYLIYSFDIPILSGIIYRTTFQYFIYFLVGAWIYWILSERRSNRT